MGQYYPQQGPLYPPEHGPESGYYDDAVYEYDETNGGRSNRSLLQTVAAFLAGGCAALLCASACLGIFAGLWVLDPTLVEGTPPPGSDIGLSFDEAALPGEQVVNDQNLQLTILEVNRNASLENIPPTEGAEVIIVTIELVNVGEEEVDYNERDFSLLNSFEEEFPATIGAIEGSLGRGTLPSNEGLEGRLVFEAPANEPDWQLYWAPADSEPRYLYLE
jgi:hypothetical protein